MHARAIIFQFPGILQRLELELEEVPLGVRLVPVRLVTAPAKCIRVT